jgi:hypothetical protein
MDPSEYLIFCNLGYQRRSFVVLEFSEMAKDQRAVSMMIVLCQGYGNSITARNRQAGAKQGIKTCTPYIYCYKQIQHEVVLTYPEHPFRCGLIPICVASQN